MEHEMVSATEEAGGKQEKRSSMTLSLTDAEVMQPEMTQARRMFGGDDK